MLEPLLRKAASDAGFDLEVGHQGNWHAMAVSGSPGRVWVTPDPPGARIAVETAQLAQEAGGSPARQGEAPTGTVAWVRSESPLAALAILRRLRAVIQQGPPRLEERWKARLAALQNTETEAVVRQRVGQDLFREALLDYWQGRCAVTGLDIPELLRASHAKPWKHATDGERLDIHNGLLLAAHLDALFDRGLLTFDDDGKGLLSGRLSTRAREALGLAGKSLSLTVVATGHLPYLAHHRAEVFQP